jgi:excisionase family DNA binding protein
MASNTAVQEPEFVTLNNAAKRLGIGRRMLRLAIDRGELPVYVVGAWPRLRLAEARRWVESQRQMPIGGPSDAR